MEKELIRSFLKATREKRVSIHCLGDAMLDEYISVNVDRISPEFPMPIMRSNTDQGCLRPGGVANVVFQMDAFNVDRSLYSFPDPKVEIGWGRNGVCRKSFPNEPRFLELSLPIKRRFLHDGVQVARLDIENPDCGLTKGQIDAIISSIMRGINQSSLKPDVAICSDYGKGFFSSSLNLLHCYREVTTIIDPKFGPLEKWKGCTIFKPNAKEAASLSGLSQWQDQCRFFQEQLGCTSVVITHGGEQVVGIDSDRLFAYQPQQKVKIESVVGAGDCFAAFLAMAVARGFSVPDAAKIAYQAGAIYVQRNMNQPLSMADFSGGGIVDPEILACRRNSKLVFTNGCFDILHEGHLKLLEFAKGKGDRLVVAVNSDESVRRLKGIHRPVKPLDQRMAVLAGLKMVDFVVSFDEDTPLEIIKKIRPDVLVKGADYQLEAIVGNDIVPEVYRAPLLDGISTTKILKGL